MLVNLTNHPSAFWADAQRAKARERWGDILDIPFPQVDPAWTTEELFSVAKATVSHVLTMSPDAILCQGETGMTFALVQLFQLAKIPVYTATSARDVEETRLEDGGTRKHSVFRFVQFRVYPDLTAAELSPLH